MAPVSTAPWSEQALLELTLEQLGTARHSQVEELAVAVAKLVTARGGGTTADPERGTPAFNRLRMEVQAICWRLAAQGALAWGLNSANDAYPFFRLTERGKGLASGGVQHPGHPEFVARVLRECPSVPGEVAARLEDAHDCFNQSLYRASVVMLRLAYEHMIRVIYDDHGIENHVPGKLKPGKRPVVSVLLDGIVHVLQNVPGPPEGTANMAMHIADVIRQDGNAAAHDWARDFADAAEVEELLILAGRNVKRLWSIKDRLP